MTNHDDVQPGRNAPSGKLKISCHSCGTRYSVPEERVRGRRFRVQCKECDGIIVARCDQGSFTVLPAEGQGHQRSPVGAPLRLDASELFNDAEVNGADLDVAAVLAEDEWYVGIAGQPHGPHTADEIVQLLAEGEITRKSYAWQIGQPSWARIGDLDAFREYLLDMQLTEIFAPDELPPDSVPELSISRLARAHTVEQHQLAADPAIGAPFEQDGYEAFGEKPPAEDARTSVSEEEQTRLRANATALERPQLVLLDSAPDAGADGAEVRIEQLSGPRAELSEAMALSERPAEEPSDLRREIFDADLNAAKALESSRRWHRPTALGLGRKPGKLETGAWQTGESGIHDKRSSTGRAWGGEAQPEERSRWSGSGPRRPTLSIVSGSRALPEDLGTPAGEGHEPLSLPSVPSAGSSDPGDMGDPSIGGAKLPTEVLLLIPRKVTMRPQREMLPRPTFAPPVPEEAIPPASPSMLVRRKPRFWSKTKLLIASLSGLTLLAVVAVAAFLITREKPETSGSNKEAGIVAASAAPAARDDAEQARATVEDVARDDEADSAAVESPAVAVAITPPPQQRTKAVRPTFEEVDDSQSRVKRRRRRSARLRARARRRAVEPSGSTRRRERKVTASPTRKARRAQPASADAVVVDVAPPAARVARETPPAAETEIKVPDPDEILALGALGAQKRRQKQGATEGLPRTLSKKAIGKVMRRLRPKVSACFDEHKNAGTLKLRITVQPYGRAVGHAVGALVGTPTAACVISALPSIRFPRFSGDPVSFTYPYVLQ